VNIKKRNVHSIGRCFFSPPMICLVSFFNFFLMIPYGYPHKIPKGYHVKILKIRRICLLFTILRPFGTRKSIRQKVDHGGQIVLWYWQHATNLIEATVFVVCMSSARVFVWVRGKVEQKRSLTFCVFG